MNELSITAAAAAEKRTGIKRTRVSGWLTGLLLFAATGAYAASSVDMYKDPG